MFTKGEKALSVMADNARGASFLPHACSGKSFPNQCPSAKGGPGACSLLIERISYAITNWIYSDLDPDPFVSHFEPIVNPGTHHESRLS